jgi:hypothetical protein
MLLPLMLVLFIAWGCSNDNPTQPQDQYRQALAGGGRLQNGDPFCGGPEDSGPTNPGFDGYQPDSGLIPLFYSDVDCGQQPTQHVIRDSAEWVAWWETAVSCLWRGDTIPPGDPVPDSGRGPDGLPGEHGDSVWIDSSWTDSNLIDSGWVDTAVVDTIYPCYDCLPEAPWVDFTRNVVVVISLEEDSGFGRSVWVNEVSSNAAGTTVGYQVSELGEDCVEILMMPMIVAPNSPTVAVQVPRPVNEPVIWVRSDTVFTCMWEPDPDLPLSLYYTDAVCDLGSGETIIRDSSAFESWMNAAWACDMARWFRTEDPTMPSGDSNWIPPGDTIIMPPAWGGFDVDFTTHAVIVLRAGEQTRWGGGIWLYDFTAGESGTTIDYTVLEPGQDCPLIDCGGLTVVNPTVAIRVPLPLSEPVTWNRHGETIDCDWGSDSTWVETDSLNGR